MRRGNFLEALKQFIASKPPLVVFIICLLCFFIILSVLMIHLNTHEVKNPDIIDWNTFKESLSSLDYCIKLKKNEQNNNNNNYNNVLSTKMTPTEKQSKFEFQTQLTIRISDGSLPLDDISSLWGRVQGHQIGLLQGHYKSDEEIGMNFYLIDSQDIRIKYELKQSSNLCKKQNNPLNKNKLNDCREIKVKACVKLVGPQYMFPKSKAPSKCEGTQSDDEKYRRLFYSFKETPDVPHQFECPSDQGIKAKINHKIDPNLTVMLSPKDKETINMNLRGCMYILAVFTTILLTYSILKHRKKPVLVYQPVNQL